MLQNEVLTSNAEAERASKELESMRNRAFEENLQESVVRERELRELQVELERCRIERDEWEREALEARVGLDETKTSLENTSRDLELEREARRREQDELTLEREKSVNLQSVLEDFQIGQDVLQFRIQSFVDVFTEKDREMRQTMRDRDTQLSQITQSLAEYKHRAHTAEVRH